MNPGVPGTYRSAAAVTLAGAESLAESFITLEGEPEDYGQLTIDTWEDDYITGRFSGRALLFWTVVRGIEEAVWVTITMRFETHVHEGTDIFGAVTANCGGAN